MSSEEISQDLICLLVGVTATIVSGVGIYTVKFISNRWNSKSPEIIDVIRKKLSTVGWGREGLGLPPQIQVLI